MNINFKTLLLGTSLSLIPTLTYAQCVATTDCATLGYTQTSCPNGKGLKCPFGNTYACPASNKSVCEKYGFKYTCTGAGYAGGIGQSCNKQYETCNCSDGYEWKDGECKEMKAILGQCTGYAKNCSIGQILNTDGICTNEKVSGKTPLAVVAYIGGDNCGQALAIDSIGTYEWSTENIDIPSLKNHSNESAATTDFDSCGNTQKIIQQGDSHTYPAAWAAVNYAPSVAPATKGKWCLPAAGIGYGSGESNNTTNYDKIFAAISAINSSTQTICGWSSTEYADDGAYDLCRYNNAAVGFLKIRSYHVRPVIEF